MHSPRAEAPASVLLYEPFARGHQAEFLLWIVRAWERRAGRLVVVAPPAVLAQRPELGDRIAANPHIRFDPLLARLDANSSFRNAVGIHRGLPLREALRRHRPAQALVMSFEYVVAPLAARLPLAPGVRLSGLSFRPAPPAAPTSAAGRAQRAARSALVRAAMRHPQFDVLFSLDPTAVPSIRAENPGVRVEAVPDPVPPGEATETPEAVRASFGIEPGRRLVVLPGALDARKGALVLPEALLLLDAAVAPTVAVLLAGQIEPGLDEALRRLVARVQAETRVQVVLHDTYVATERLPSLLAAADLVALPYVEHAGSSGFQLRAAAAGVPALTPDHGLMGHLARTHALGRTVDTRSAAAVARAVEEALATPAAGFDPARARAFAASRSVDGFADALLDPLVGPPATSAAPARPHAPSLR